MLKMTENHASGSGSLEDDLTDQKAAQRSCFDRGSDSHASQDHPPCITHYPFVLSGFFLPKTYNWSLD